MEVCTHSVPLFLDSHLIDPISRGAIMVTMRIVWVYWMHRIDACTPLAIMTPPILVVAIVHQIHIGKLAVRGAGGASKSHTTSVSDPLSKTKVATKA